MITVELSAIELFGHHGEEEDERARGQPFLIDVEYDVDSEAAEDALERTVDYREVLACVREISDGRRYRLLEALAAAVADALVARFPVQRARVRVRKPAVRLDAPVAYAAATAERRAPER